MDKGTSVSILLLFILEIYYAAIRSVTFLLQHERSVRRPGSTRRPSSNTRPSKTLFVINFDPYHTRTRDIERHFEPYGKIVSVRIRRNFAFVQYEAQEDASRALDATNMRFVFFALPIRSLFLPGSLIL